MQFHPIYKELGYSTPADVFSGLMSSLSDGINGWDYFVAWDKIHQAISPIKERLSLLNSLIGEGDIVEAARGLITRYPEVISILPILLAVREKNLSVLSDYKLGLSGTQKFDFSKKLKDIGPADINAAVSFMEGSGILGLLANRQISSLVDYVTGVEVGLDTNARKNRSGTSMEQLVKFFLDDFCRNNNLEAPIPQATNKQTLEKFGKTFTADKTDRRVDFAVNLGDRLLLVEVNFYGSKGGSKLKSTAEEYVTRQAQWRKDGHLFIWVTDGRGWLSAKAPLHEAFNSIDHVINLDMMYKGVFKALLNL